MLSTTGSLPMPAGESSGVSVVKTGSGAAGDVAARSEGVAGLASDGVLERLQVQGAYHEPWRTVDAMRRTLGEAVAPVRQFADWSGFGRRDDADPTTLRAAEENCRHDQLETLECNAIVGIAAPQGAQQPSLGARHRRP